MALAKSFEHLKFVVQDREEIVSQGRKVRLFKDFDSRQACPDVSSLTVLGDQHARSDFFR